jgi:hypothetical protein
MSTYWESQPRVRRCVAFGGLLASALAIVLLAVLVLRPAGATAAPAFDCSTVTEVPQAECRALVALYNSTDGPAWKNHSGWLATNTPCSWSGVGCNAGHVYGLGLHWNGLSGPLPPQMGDLTNLAVLFLSQNHLTGLIPHEIGNLTGLTTLDLGDNDLSGPIPGQLGSLPHVTFIDLSNNQLTGGVPWQFGGLLGLWSSLDFSDNPLSGPLPMSLTAIPLEAAFGFGNTNLCELPDFRFQAWLARIRNVRRSGLVCPSPAPTPTCTAPIMPSPYSIHVNAGGSLYTDTTGLVWQTDQAYDACTGAYWGATGGQVYTSSHLIAGAADQALYQSERYFAGAAGYRFVAPDGEYTVTLRFAEIYPYAYAGSRVFDVNVEGQTIVSGLDVFARSGGLNHTYDVTARVTVSDGVLNLDFVPLLGHNAPFVSAIAVTQVMPATEPTSSP